MTDPASANPGTPDGTSARVATALCQPHRFPLDLDKLVALDKRAQKLVNQLVMQTWVIAALRGEHAILKWLRTSWNPLSSGKLRPQTTHR